MTLKGTDIFLLCIGRAEEVRAQRKDKTSDIVLSNSSDGASHEVRQPVCSGIQLHWMDSAKRNDNGILSDVHFDRIFWVVDAFPSMVDQT